LLSKQLATEQDDLVILQTETGDLDKARAIIQQAALDTQENLRVRIEALVTTALRSVFQDKDLSFHVEFEMKRGRTECILTIAEDGHQVDPLLGHGGGACDIASFALRCAFWSLDRTRPVLILDEPMKFLRGTNILRLAADMIKMVASELGVQIIMVSHVPEFIDVADKVFAVTHDRGISTVD
jgi:DNA repair exonuclease SbcCD ATPase subunit